MEAAIAMAPHAPAIDTRDTSRAALDAFGLKKTQKQQRELLEVIELAQRRGAVDLSLTELRDAFEQHFGRRIDVSRVSARVSELVAAKVLTRREDSRPCAVTGKPVHPFFLPPKQTRLFA
jgi:hypothetical protein